MLERLRWFYDGGGWGDEHHCSNDDDDDVESTDIALYIPLRFLNHISFKSVIAITKFNNLTFLSID